MWLDIHAHNAVSELEREYMAYYRDMQKGKKKTA